MKIAIIGAGAMGCRFGGALSTAGADVWFYDIWQEHISKINKEGLIIHTDDGIHRVLVKATSNIMSIGKPDVIFIFTKSMHTENAMMETSKIMNSDTIVVTLQNGLGNIETIKRYVDTNNIIAGVTNYASDLISPGEIEAKGLGITKMMQLGGGTHNRTEVIAGLLNEGGIHTQLSCNVMIDIWEKIAFNAALNILTSLTFLTVGGLGSVEEGVDMARKISSEVISVANAEGINTDAKKVHQTIESVFKPEMSGDHKTSMLQDRMMKKKTEIEAIAGQVIKLAKDREISIPNLESVYQLVKIIEQSYDIQLI
ncbi:MAG: ketopantoate reductase family protein [Eubacteriales bacterium]